MLRLREFCVGHQISAKVAQVCGKSSESLLRRIAAGNHDRPPDLRIPPIDPVFVSLMFQTCGDRRLKSQSEFI
jgi:hypothetical protein